MENREEKKEKEIRKTATKTNEGKRERGMKHDSKEHVSEQFTHTTLTIKIPLHHKAKKNAWSYTSTPPLNTSIWRAVNYAPHLIQLTVMCSKSCVASIRTDGIRPNFIRIGSVHSDLQHADGRTDR